MLYIFGKICQAFAGKKIYLRCRKGENLFKQRFVG